MVQTPGRVVEAGGDVLRLHMGVIVQHLLRSLARGQQFQHVPDPDAHAADSLTSCSAKPYSHLQAHYSL